MHPDYSADVQALREYLTPIARDAIDIPYYDDGGEGGLGIMAIFALFLENDDVGRRAMQRILKYEDLMLYKYAGQIAAMIGEIGIAQRMISHFEDRYDKQLTHTVDRARQFGASDPEAMAAAWRRYTEYDAIDAGAIAARLSDPTTALRLLQKFQANKHYAAALHLAADIDEHAALERLLAIITAGSLNDAAGGDPLLYTICGALLKTIMYQPTLSGPWVLRLCADLDNETVEYDACVGKLAARLGGETLELRAGYASYLCFNRNKPNDGRIIDAMRGKLSGVQHLIERNHEEANGDIRTLLGILVRKQPRFVFKMVKNIEKRSGRESDMHFLALEILERLAE